MDLDFSGDPELADEAYYASKRVPEYIYFSHPFEFKSRHIPGSEHRIGEISRFAYTVTVPESSVSIERNNGVDILIRETRKYLHQIRAIFFEDDREIPQVWIQRFTGSGKLTKNGQIILTGREVSALREFLETIDRAQLPQGTNLRVAPSVVREILADPDNRRRIYETNREEIYRLIENDETAKDVRAVARRRKQLEVFQQMLNDPSLVRSKAEEMGVNGTEAVWQKYFEENRWIFGLGLAEQVLFSWDRRKMEAVVRGASIAGPGKRADAVLRSAGIFSSFVFVEIKTPETALLREKEYRPGVWGVTEEIAGAVAQCHRTLEEAQVQFGDRLPVKDEHGFDTGEIVHYCRPRSYLIVGDLRQFVSDNNRLHHERYRCFEQFRRSLSDPIIITYDELFERASRLLDMEE